MRVIADVRTLDASYPGVVMTVGSFDGVHLGHRRVLQEVLEVARVRGGTAAVMTFVPHPREFFSPAHAPNLLTTHRRKLELLEEMGMNLVFILPFDESTAGLCREDFVRDVLCGCCHVSELIVGHDFRFGKGVAGDFEYLQEVAPSLGFSVRQVPPLFVNGECVSSTAIRERILLGDLEEAEAFLGRKYSVVGEVMAGRGVGVTLGFPTANIRPCHSAIPAHGVYVARVLCEGNDFPAAVNIGVAPTIEQDAVTIEAFLLDFHGDLRGREIEVVFHKRLRGEKKFGSREELVEAIGQDVEAVQGYFQNV